MGPFLHDPPAVEHHDPRRILHCGEAVGDDHGGLAREGRAQVVEDRRLGLGVDRRQGVVEEEDRRVLGQRPGDGGALLLAAGEVDAALPQERVVAVRQRGQRLGELGLFGAPLEAPVVGHPEEDVLAHGGAEEEGLLRHVAYGPAKVGERDPADVDPVDQDLAFGGVVGAGEELDERALP